MSLKFRFATAAVVMAAFLSPVKAGVIVNITSSPSGYFAGYGVGAINATIDGVAGLLYCLEFTQNAPIGPTMYDAIPLVGLAGGIGEIERRQAWLAEQMVGVAFIDGPLQLAMWYGQSGAFSFYHALWDLSYGQLPVGPAMALRNDQYQNFAWIPATFKPYDGGPDPIPGNPTPEPSTFAMVGLALMALSLRRSR